MKRIAVLLVVVSAIACGSKSPTTPSPTTTTTTTPTRIINLGGNLAFGSIQIGQTFSATMEIRNDGTAPLNVTGITVPSAGAPLLTFSFLNGTIAPKATQTVTVRYSPKTLASFSGVVTVNGDQTSGANTLPISGTGTNAGLPLFTRSGTGDTVFDMPLSVGRIKITGRYTANSSNFIVHIGGNHVVNELLGTFWSSTTFEGTYVTTGGVVEILSSSGVQWSFTEVR